jgi:hypothetical protein
MPPSHTARPGDCESPLLPGILAGRVLKCGPDRWAVFAFFVLPIAFFCILPVLAAVIGGRVARHLDVARASLPRCRDNALND